MPERRKLEYGDLVEVKDSELRINGCSRPRVHKYGRGIVIRGESDIFEDVVLMAFRSGVLCDIMDVADLDYVGHVDDVRRTVMAAIEDVIRGYGIRHEVIKNVGNELTLRLVFPNKTKKQ